MLPRADFDVALIGAKMLAKNTIDSVQHFRIVVDGENDWLRHGRRGEEQER